jgi:putative hydrolase of the HAD superfamily
MIRAVIFDLGNVLLHFDHRLIEHRLLEQCPGTRDDEEARKTFWDLAGAFERGGVDADGFLERWNTMVGGCLETAELKRLWNDIFWINDSAVRLVTGMPEELRLVLLSNTNPLHVEYARARFPEVFARFAAQVYSYEVGAAKPDTAMFDAAMLAARALPEETLYFDDIAAYVRAAAEYGIKAYQYVSGQGVRDVLAIHGIEITGQ